MAVTINRYNLDKKAPGMFKHSTGGWVKHQDHEAAMQVLREQLDQLRSEFVALQAPRRVTWRHVKRGSEYVVLARGELQSSAGPIPEGTRLITYQGTDDGRVWVRPVDEFEDGRFVPVEP